MEIKRSAYGRSVGYEDTDSYNFFYGRAFNWCCKCGYFRGINRMNQYLQITGVDKNFGG